MLEDIVFQLPGEVFAGFGGCEAQSQRHGEGGLTAAGVGTVLPVRLLKRGGEAICVSGGSGGTGGISQDEGCVSHDGQVAIVKRAGGKTQGSKLPVSGSPRPDVVPIAEAISQQPILEFAVEVAVISLHGAVAFRKRLAVAVDLPAEPGQLKGRAAPFGRIAEAAAEDDVLRGDVGHQAIDGLRLAHVADDLGKEGGQIPVEKQGGTHQMELFQPAEFLAMGAIGQRVLEVAAHGGVDESVNLVKAVI